MDARSSELVGKSARDEEPEMVPREMLEMGWRIIEANAYRRGLEDANAYYAELIAALYKRIDRQVMADAIDEVLTVLAARRPVGESAPLTALTSAELRAKLTTADGFYRMRVAEVERLRAAVGIALARLESGELTDDEAAGGAIRALRGAIATGTHG